MICAASSSGTSGVIVIGSGVIHWRTRASLVWTRAAIALSRSRSVRIPIRRPKSFTITAPIDLVDHAPGHLAERVLGRDRDEVLAHDVCYPHGSNATGLFVNKS